MEAGARRGSRGTSPSRGEGTCDARVEGRQQASSSSDQIAAHTSHSLSTPQRRKEVKQSVYPGGPARHRRARSAASYLVQLPASPRPPTTLPLMLRFSRHRARSQRPPHTTFAKLKKSPNRGRLGRRWPYLCTFVLPLHPPSQPFIPPGARTQTHHQILSPLVKFTILLSSARRLPADLTHPHSPARSLAQSLNHSLSH